MNGPDGIGRGWMPGRKILLLGPTVLVLLWIGIGLWAQQKTEPTVVLDTSGYWRVHHTYSPPVVKKGNAVEKLSTRTGTTALPPLDWMQCDFDDGDWTRIPGKPFPGTKLWLTPPELLDAGYTGTESTSTALALTCLRAKFQVTDPAAVKGLKLSLAYRGGARVYVNGKELVRGHLAKDAALDAWAEEYPIEAFVKPDGSLAGGSYVEKKLDDPEALKIWRMHVRRLDDVVIPSAMLRKGANVLAVEIHRTPYPEKMLEVVKQPAHLEAYVLWNTCALVGTRLTAEGTEGIVQNAVRPAGFQVWNSSLLNPDYDLDWGDPSEPLRPIRMVGPRNGVASGKVVVGCDQPIKGLMAAVGELTGKGGKIPATAVRVRYALPTGVEPATPVGRFPAAPTLLDGLTETAPQEVPVRQKPPAVEPFIAPGQPKFVFGAVAPVWVTVAIPADTPAGDYKGMLTITAEGLAKPFESDVEVKVCPWQCPKPAEFHTIVDFMQSPETLALYYDVPLYGDKHWELIATSMRHLGYIGNWTLYVPLICHTNQGNEQSLIRWVKQADGTWKHDFTNFDRYLDLAEKHMGKPRVICLYVWDLFVGGSTTRHQNDVNPGYGGKPLVAGEIPVTSLDEATGQVSTVAVGTYSDKTRADWQKLVTGMAERLRKRGLAGAVELGLAGDGRPSAEIVKFWAELMPGVPWMRHGHMEWQEFGTTGGKVDFQANVVPMTYLKDPAADKYSCYGWKRPDKRVMFFRTWDASPPIITIRLLGEINVTGYQRGFGRMGLDFWPVLKDARGRRTGELAARYPESSHHQVDVFLRALLPPGPDGALATGKLENLREGLQEAEARIFIESALTDEAKRARLGDELTRRAQITLDDRTKFTFPFLEESQIIGFQKTPFIQLNGAEYGFGYTGARAILFYQWYATTRWQERSEKLYGLAAEVAEALKK